MKDKNKIKKNKIKKIIILSDGIRGHFHQSLGVAKWLERMAGAEIAIIEVPKFSGFKRFLYLKFAAQFLKFKSKNYALKWLKLTGFNLENININDESKILILSTGSTAAPYNLAVKNLLGSRAVSAVIMTPSIGLKCFDFAIIPEHDNKNKLNKINDNCMTTLGAPNHIYIPELKSQAEKFFCDIMPSKNEKFENEKVIAVLIGGSDANYEINSEWADGVISGLINATEAQNALNLKSGNAALLITTSRRTGKLVDDKIESIIRNHKNVKYFLPASRNPDINPVPAMLGAATHVIATEDSVSMVSEAVTAGFHVGLLRTYKKTGFLVKLRNLTGGGTSRFDKLFEEMINKNMICDLGVKPDFNMLSDFLSRDAANHNIKFNEAEHAAEWLLERI